MKSMLNLGFFFLIFIPFSWGQKENLKNFFIENKGQWPENVLFLTHIGGLDAWITEQGVLFDFFKFEKSSANSTIETISEIQDLTLNRNGHIIKWNFFEGNIPIAKGQQKKREYYNYFLGNESKKWASHIALYEEVLIEDIYNGIDVRYYFEGPNLRYDYIVHPGSDPSQISLSIEGSQKVQINEKNELVLLTRFGEVKQANLVVYQIENGQKKIIPAEWINKNEYFTFLISPYNRHKTLVIDPLIYSTFLGGNKDEEFNSIAVDAEGNAYVTGYTYSANYFPTTTGAYDESHNGYKDVLVSKLNNTGSKLVYSTFIGGRKSRETFYGPPDDIGYSIAVDKNGDVYIAGASKSIDYPTTPGAFDQVHSDEQMENWARFNVIVTKLSNSGDSLIYSTFIKGIRGGELAYAIAVDPSGNAYVAGDAGSSDDFPTTDGSFDRKNEGFREGFVLKLNSKGSELVYSTFLGGKDYDEINSIAIDSLGNAYLTGYTSSFDFPTTAGVLDRTHNGYDDIFVAKLNNNGTSLIFSTFIGESGTDVGNSIAIDIYGNSYVTGSTTSLNFPTTNNTLYNGGGDAFVVKLNNTGSKLMYSTFLGGPGGYDIGHSVAIDHKGDAYIGGRTASKLFPRTSNAYDLTFNGGARDAFVSKIGENGRLIYSTYIGGVYEDQCSSLCLDSMGDVYFTGTTFSGNFPTTAGTFDNSHNDNGFGFDGYITKMDLSSITSVKEMDLLQAFSISPNPVKGILLIELNEANSLKIYNSYGQLLIEKHVSLTHSIDFSRYSAGIYFVQAGGRTQKVIKF